MVSCPVGVLETPAPYTTLPGVSGFPPPHRPDTSRCHQRLSSFHRGEGSGWGRTELLVYPRAWRYLVPAHMQRGFSSSFIPTRSQAQWGCESPTGDGAPTWWTQNSS